MNFQGVFLTNNQNFSYKIYITNYEVINLEIYVVKQGDTLYKIAQQFGVTTEKLIADNELTEPDNLVVGQTIVIVKNNRMHTVQSGDTLFKIAQMYNVSLADLTKANPQITNPFNLQIGSVVYIPQLNKPEIEVNGYAFVNISDEVLEKTLPSLTYLSIFSYEVLPDGELVSFRGGCSFNRKGKSTKCCSYDGCNEH